MFFRKRAAAAATVLFLSSCLCSADYSVHSAKAAVTSVYGDVNGDGAVNVFDCIHVKQNLVGTRDGFSVTNWKPATGVHGGDTVTDTSLENINRVVLSCNEETPDTNTIKVCNGIDVSKWQGDVDWQKVRAAGIEFAMIKAGEGTEVEPKFLQNIKGAKDAGIQCGIYWFSSAREPEEVPAEVAACIETIKPYQLEYPVVYDFEYRCFYDLEKDPLANDRQKCTDIIYAFLDGMENAGYYAMLYSNKNFPKLYLDKKQLTDRFDFWYANYSASEPDETCGIWQRSNKGRIDGINADVDLDISYVDYKSVMINNHLNGY